MSGRLSLPDKRENNMIAEITIREHNPKDKRIKKRLFYLVIHENNYWQNSFDIPLRDSIGSIELIGISFKVKRVKKS